MFVLDCSVAMSWYFEDEKYNQVSEAYLEKLKETPAIVPAIWSLEVSNVLLTALRKKRISSADIEQFIKYLAALPIEYDLGLGVLINHDVMTLAQEHNLSAYDAAYIELAQRYKIPIATLDADLMICAKKLNILLY